LSKLVLNGDTSGSVTLDAPAVSGTTVLTLPTTSGTVLTTASTFGGTGPAFLVSLITTNQSISVSTYTKVQFNNVNYDTASDWDAVNYRFIPSVAGYYQFNLNITMSATSITETITTLWKNGAETVWSAILGGSSFNRCTPVVSTILYMNGTTDYIEGYGYIRGGTSPVFSAESMRTSLSGCLIRSA
jgi:hypothetical protein